MSTWYYGDNLDVLRAHVGDASVDLVYLDPPFNSNASYNMIVNPAMVRDLGRVLQRDGHRLGLFVCAALPTRGMIEEANSHGLIDTEFGRYPALQIFTLAELFQDRHPRLPPLVSPHRRAARVEMRASHLAGAQPSLI